MGLEWNCYFVGRVFALLNKYCWVSELGKKRWLRWWRWPTWFIWSFLYVMLLCYDPWFDIPL